MILMESARETEMKKHALPTSGRNTRLFEASWMDFTPGRSFALPIQQHVSLLELWVDARCIKQSRSRSR